MFVPTLDFFRLKTKTGISGVWITVLELDHEFLKRGKKARIQGSLKLKKLDEARTGFLAVAKLGWLILWEKLEGFRVANSPSMLSHHREVHVSPLPTASHGCQNICFLYFWGKASLSKHKQIFTPTMCREVIEDQQRCRNLHRFHIRETASP